MLDLPRPCRYEDLTAVAVLRRTGGVYLVHNPAYKIIRQFDGEGLRDCVVYRVWRKRIYRSVWQAVLAVTWVAIRLSSNCKKEK